MVAGIEVRVGADFAAMAKRLRGMDAKEIRARFTTGIRKATEPVESALVDSITNLPVESSHGGGSAARVKHTLSSRKKVSTSALKKATAGSGLRSTIARAITTKVTTSGKSTGVQVTVDSSKLPADQRMLPLALNSANGFKHPTFGHNPEVTQDGHEWWDSTIKPHKAGVIADAARVVDGIQSELDRG